MNRAEAERLLGGHATGTLTEAERSLLFAAALEHQELFNALADQEGLRELLADPVARAQLLAALAPVAPKVVPLWRRPGLLAAAASLLVGTTAGLVYLRSPEAGRVPALQEAPKAAPKPVDVPAVAAPKPTPALTPARPKAVPAPSPEDAARRNVQAKAQAQEDKRAEAPRPAALASKQADAPPKAEEAQDSSGVAPGSVPGGVVGGVIGGARAAAASAPPPAKAKRDLAEAASAVTQPRWALEPRPDGTTLVTVTGPRGVRAVLLQRGAGGVRVLGLEAFGDPGGSRAQWRCLLRLEAGDVLDLYLLNAPVAVPANLPETGSVDGFRARIHPPSKEP
ncbi:MAG: hypothetical protein HGB30_12890 [Holophagaceae bacterium]|nr:hypothetical protein [Holophagaceae bacterium]